VNGERGPALFVNGRVRTMDDTRPLAEALAVSDGVLTAVGSTADLLRSRDPRATVVDLGGATMLPGFLDVHNHFALAALEGFWADCRDARSIADVQARLRAAAEATPVGEWVRGLGYHHGALAERRHPSRHELDAAVGDRPALLLHFTHHQGVASSRALTAGGITRATPDPPGGAVERDRAGEPTGLLYERALGEVERASREGWERRFPEVARAASRRHAALGLTTLQDPAVSPALEARYRAAEATGALEIGVGRMAVAPTGWFDPPWALARTPGEGRWLKLFVDGGYRCAMRLERGGRLQDTGFLFYRPDELADLLVTAWRAGWRVTLHAIGNLGVEVAVGGLEAALRREPAATDCARLDHVMFVSRPILDRLRALSVWVVSQPSFLHDLGPAALDPRHGLLVRAFGSIREAGIPQAFSSDAPCGSVAPLLGIHAAVTRRDREGRPVSPDEGVPVEAAVRAYTIDAARAAGLDRDRGSLVPGKRADFVVLVDDPFTVAADSLAEIVVRATYVGGRLIPPPGG
jgi:predicted amidohydrolase YtcJ